jgi:hypothetical protein
MKRFIAKLFVFALVFVCFFCVALLVYGTAVPTGINIFRLPGHFSFTLQDVEKAKNVDILFLGASNCYRAYDPRVFSRYGITIFNLGSSSQTPLQTELLLKRYAKKISPRLVVLNPGPWGFMSDGVESGIDIMLNSRTDYDIARMAAKSSNVKSWITLLYCAERDLFNIALNRQPVKSKGDTYISQGYVERILYFYKERSHENYDWQPKPEQIQAFSDTVNWLKENNIPYILVYPPTTDAFYSSFIGYDKYKKLMDSAGRFYDSNIMFPLNDTTCFYDYGHLNQNGVEIYDTAFIDWLRKSSILD